MLAQPNWDGVLSPLASGTAPSESISALLNWVREALRAQQTLLLLPEPSGLWVDFAYVSGENAEEIQGLRVRPDETLVEPVLIERMPWHSVATTFEGRSLAPEIPADALQSIFAVPLPGVQMGALAVLNPSETAPEAVFAVLQQVAPTLGVLVTLQATQIQLQQRERALKWLRNLPTRLGDEICLPKVMEATERLLRKVSSVGGGLWLYDEDRTRLLCSVQYGTPRLPEQVDPSALPSDWKASPVDISHDGRLFRLYPLNLAERTLGFIALA
ncbi:MAG: hypothetical protein SNJ72_11190, partial [Fimbriimonadales bacterium]